MATTPQPISTAIIQIYNAEEYGVTGPIATADPKDDPGYYKVEDLDEGDYTYLVSATGKGSVVGDFSLPGPVQSAQGALQKNIPPITLVSGVDVNLTIRDKDNKPIIKDGAGGPTGPTGVTGITGDLDIQIARLYATGGGEGVYTVDDVPVGQRLIEVLPSNLNIYQNLKILRNISSATTDIDITLYPPVTVYVTVNKVDMNLSNPIPVIDTTCRLFETTSGGIKIREITTKTSNDFKISSLADGIIYLQVYDPTGETKLGDQATITVSYSDSVDGASYKWITYNYYSITSIT